MAMGDFWTDQAALTVVVRRNIEAEAAASPGAPAAAYVGQGAENRAYYGASIAPLKTVASRHTRIRISDVLPHGMGQFKARDASPPLMKTKPTVREEAIEMVLLEEMERFTSEEWLLLNSSDPAISRGAKLSLVDRLTIMSKRNALLTEWMRWQAFKGGFAVTYPDGGSETYDYGFVGSHLPTAATAWTDKVNSDPVEDSFAWQQVGANDAGQYYVHIHLNSNTFKLVQQNEKIAGYLSSYGRSIMRPTVADINSLMRAGTTWHILDAGYLPEGSTQRILTKFLPDNRVLYTTSYTLFGIGIADVADGQVLVGGTQTSPPGIASGPQSEVITNPFTKNVFRRYASARVPRIYLAEAFLYATVGA
jgi:hypothetical protein